jgi:hypothetical protein
VQSLEYTHSRQDCHGKNIDSDKPISGTKWFEGINVAQGKYAKDRRYLVEYVMHSVGYAILEFETMVLGGVTVDLPPWKTTPDDEYAMSQGPISADLPTGWPWTPCSKGYVHLWWDCCCDKPYVKSDKHVENI